MNQDLKYHHIGKVVKSIERQYTFYKNLGFVVVSGFEKKLIDEKQNVRVGAVRKGSILIELLEPFGKNSPIANFLKNGHGGFHHVCFHCKNLRKTIEIFKETFGFRQITPITVSVWRGRPVVFFISGETDVIELIGSKNEKF